MPTISGSAACPGRKQMSKYFMQDTRYAAFERMMMAVPTQRSRPEKPKNRPREKPKQPKERAEK